MAQPPLERHAGEAADEPGDHQHGDRGPHDAAELWKGASSAPATRATTATAARTQPRVEVTRPRPSSAGGQVQRRQGEHVAEGGDERCGHVVEVPSEADGSGRQAQGGGEDRQRGERSAADRDEREVGQADRGAEPEADRDEGGEDDQDEGHAQGEGACGEHVLAEDGRCAGARSWSSPAWMDVETRLPREPNTLPRSPMAAGMSTRRPGRRSKVAVRDPSIAPATRLVEEFSASATSPCRASAPGSRRRRAMEAVRGR